MATKIPCRFVNIQVLYSDKLSEVYGMLYTTTDNNTDKWKIYGTGILIIIGLFARDMYGVGINKYLFLLLAMIPIFFAEINRKKQKKQS